MFVLVDDVDAPQLDDAARHHVVDVRRLRPGADLTVGDGAGRTRGVVLGPDGKLTPAGEVTAHAKPDPPITIAFALTKGAKPELVIQKLTEIGVDRIVPFVAERSVVRWDDDKAARNVARWRSVARAAAEQCERPWLPEIAEVADFSDVVALSAVRVDRGGPRLSSEATVVAVGPEGGWSDGEREAIPAHFGLGDHVLRAETAAIVSAAVAVGARGGFIHL